MKVNYSDVGVFKVKIECENELKKRIEEEN
jgi:hypothetical protein